MGRRKQIPVGRHDGLDWLADIAMWVYMCWPRQCDAVTRKRTLDRLRAEAGSNGRGAARGLLAEMLEADIKRVWGGSEAGNLLLQRCQLHAANISTSLDSVRAQIAEHRHQSKMLVNPLGEEGRKDWVDRPKLRSQRNKLHKSEFEFSSVSHYWAAFVWLESDGGRNTLKSALHVPHFVGLALGIADYASQRRLKGRGSQKPFLDKKALWCTDIDDRVTKFPFEPYKLSDRAAAASSGL